MYYWKKWDIKLVENIVIKIRCKRILRDWEVEQSVKWPQCWRKQVENLIINLEQQGMVLPSWKGGLSESRQ